MHLPDTFPFRFSRSLISTRISPILVWETAYQYNTRSSLSSNSSISPSPFLTFSSHSISKSIGHPSKNLPSLLKPHSKPAISPSPSGSVLNLISLSDSLLFNSLFPPDSLLPSLYHDRLADSPSSYTSHRATPRDLPGEMLHRRRFSQSRSRLSPIPFRDSRDLVLPSHGRSGHAKGGRR